MTLLELVNSLCEPLNSNGIPELVSLAKVLELATKEHIVELEEIVMRDGDSLNAIISDRLQYAYVFNDRGNVYFWEVDVK